MCKGGKPSDSACRLSELSSLLHAHLHPRRPQSEARVLNLERLVDAQEAIIPHHLSQDDLDLEHGEQAADADPRAVGKWRESVRALLIPLEALPAGWVHLVDVVTPYIGVEQGHGWAQVDKGAFWDGYSLDDDILGGCAVVGRCCGGLVAKIKKARGAG